MTDTLNEIKDGFYSFGWDQFGAKSANRLIYEHENGFIYRLLISSRLSQGGKLIFTSTFCRKSILDAYKGILKKKSEFYGMTFRETRTYMDDRPIEIQVQEWHTQFLTFVGVDVFEEDEKKLLAYNIDDLSSVAKIGYLSALVAFKNIEELRAIKSRVDNGDSPFSSDVTIFDPVYLDRAISLCEKAIELDSE